MPPKVLVKTPAGQEEIQNRNLHLTPRLRALLVLIDGKHSANTLLSTLQAIGVTKENLQQLLKQGLIAYADPARIVQRSTNTETSNAAHVETSEVQEISSALDAAQKIAALYELFNGFIRPTFGFRGVMLQLQMERCSTLNDYRVLTIAVLKSLQSLQGAEAVSLLKSRIEAIMGPIQKAKTS